MLTQHALNIQNMKKAAYVSCRGILQSGFPTDRRFQKVKHLSGMRLSWQEHHVAHLYSEGECLSPCLNSLSPRLSNKCCLTAVPENIDEDSFHAKVLVRKLRRAKRAVTFWRPSVRQNLKPSYCKHARHTLGSVGVPLHLPQGSITKP